MNVKQIIGNEKDNHTWLVVTDKDEIEEVDKDLLRNDVGLHRYMLLTATFEHIEDVATTFWDMDCEPFYQYREIQLGGECNMIDFRCVKDLAEDFTNPFLFDFLDEHGKDGLRFIVNFYSALANYLGE